MRPVTVTAAAGVNGGFSTVVPVDYMISPLNLGLGFEISGTVTYKLQYTVSDVLNATVTPVWFDSTDIVGKTTNQYGSFTSPIRGIRAAVTAGTGSVQMTVVQAGVR